MTSHTGTIISGTRELRQEELVARAARVATGLRRLGIREDDSIALVLRNDFPFFEATIGAGLIGAYAVPINWHFTADEAGYILRDSNAKAVVVHADLLPQIADGLPRGISVLVAPTPPEISDAYGIAPELCRVPPDAIDWTAWFAQQSAWEGPTRPGLSMIYTSGTTGRPKGVRRERATPAMQQVRAQMLALVFELRPGARSRTVLTGPMYHAGPNSYAFAAVHAGARVFLQPRFDAEELLRLIEREHITHLHLVPTMFVRLLQLPQEVRRQYDVSSLQFVVHAAAPCPPSVKRQMIDWWGPIINEYYGGTESGAVVFHTSIEALQKPGTVGRAVEGATIKILDIDGRELGPHQVGDIYMRVAGYSDFTYHGLEDERRKVERDGLITCGDMGYLDEDGYLFLCDRRRDMVISGGVNIYPAEIEAVLVTMPGVRDCAVFGIPDAEYGEALCAYVEPQDGATLSAEGIRAFLRPHLARYKIPKLIEFSHGLPREDTGKVFKRGLRAQYWEAAGRQI